MSQGRKKGTNSVSTNKFNINESVRAPSAMVSSVVSHSLPTLTGDQALQAVGGKSKDAQDLDKFQILAGIVAILTYASAGWICYGLPYLYNDDPKYVKVLCNTSNPEHTYPCGLEEACASGDFEYSESTSVTMVNWVISFKAGCLNQEELHLLGSFYFGGYLAGSLIFLTLSDFIGRKRIVIAGLSLQIAATISVIFVRNFYFLYGYICLMGLRTPMASHINYMLLMEQVQGGVRPYFSLLINGFDGLSNTFLALVYLYLANWYHWFLVNIGLVVLCLLVYIFFMKESPRYLISKRKFKEARAVYTFIAKVNGRPKFESPLQGESISSSFKSSQLTSSEVKKKKTSILDFWRGHSCREKALLFVFPWCWFVAVVVIYGISFSIDKLKGNIYYNGMVMGVSDLCITLSISVVAKHLGRKKAWILTFSLGTIGCFLYDFVPLDSKSILNYVILVVARLGAGGSNALSLLITSQHFPTEYRGTVFALCNSIARTGGIISPLIQNWTSHFMAVFGSMCFSALLLTFLTKETKGQRMQDFAKEQAGHKKTSVDQQSLLEKEGEEEELHEQQ